MKIKNKKTGALITVPKELEQDVRKAISSGIDPMTILQSTEVMKMGGKLPMYQNAGLIPFTQNAPQNNKYKFNQSIKPPVPYEDSIIDENLMQNQGVYYNPNQSNELNPNVITDEPIVNQNQFNPELTQSLIDYNSEKGKKTNVYGTQNELSQLNNNFTPNVNVNGFGNQYLAKGIGQLSSGIMNTSKGIVDTIGSAKQNKAELLRNQKQYAQSVYSDAIDNRLNPNNRGANNFVDTQSFGQNGLEIRDIGGYGNPNVEVEGNEHIILPNGFSQEIQGKTHAEGGIDLNLPEGSKILSEHLKLKIGNKKKSYADIGKKFETKKNVEMLSHKNADEIQKNTAQMAIKFKKQKLDELFETQEQNKMQGLHGLDVQMEALQQNNPQFAQKGIIVKDDETLIKEGNNRVGTNNLGSGKAPNKNANWKLTYDNTNRYFDRIGVPHPDFNNVNHSVYQSFIDKYENNTGDLTSDLMRNDVMPLTAKHRDILKKSGVKDWKKITRFSQLKDQDFKKIQGSSNTFDLDDNFLKTGFEDTLQGQRRVDFQASLHTPTQARNIYKTGAPGNIFYDSKDPKKMLYNPQQTGEGKTTVQYPILTEYEDRLTRKKDKPVLPQTQYKDRWHQPINEINPNINIPLALPNIYSRIPENMVLNDPSFINERYLDIQPQLNQVSRGQRALQNNLGDRSAANISNLLQAQTNAYNQNENIYGSKYNYDKQQDSAIQQFNAQARMNTGQFNTQTNINPFLSRLSQREANIGDQQLTDQYAAIQREDQRAAYDNNRNYIENTFPYYSKMSGDAILQEVTGKSANKSKKGKRTEKYDDNNKLISRTYTDQDESAKNGGVIKNKFKIKPKLRK